MPIDVHAHYVPSQLLKAVEAEGAQIGVRLSNRSTGNPAVSFDYGFSTRPLFPKLFEQTGDRRRSLDRQRLDRQLVATWPDMYGYGLEPDSCAAWHRLLNNTLAEWCDDNADRFSLVASVPLADGQKAAEELVRVVDIGAVAIMVPANIEGQNIGEFSLDPLWVAAERLGVPVIIHPVLTVASPRTEKFCLTQIVQYTFDTTLGVGSLLLTGVLDRIPSLTLILSHGGGALPYLVGRFDIMTARMGSTQGVTSQRAPSAYASRMAYDTIVHSPNALRFLVDIAGLDQLVLGTDESFPPADLAPLDSLRNAGFSEAEMRLVSDENPRRLIPRLK